MPYRKLLSSLSLLFLLLTHQTFIFAAGGNIREDFDGGLKPLWVVSDPTYVREIDGTLDIDFYGDPPENHWASNRRGKLQL